MAGHSIVFNALAGNVTPTSIGLNAGTHLLAQIGPEHAPVHPHACIVITRFWLRRFVILYLATGSIDQRRHREIKMTWPPAQS